MQLLFYYHLFLQVFKILLIYYILESLTNWDVLCVGLGGGQLSNFISQLPSIVIFYLLKI